MSLFAFETPTRLASECPLCKRPLRRQTRKSDGSSFLACSGFPRCKFAEDLDVNLQRIHKTLTAAQNDNECMLAWLRAVQHHLEVHAKGCAECERHLEDIKRFV